MTAAPSLLFNRQHPKLPVEVCERVIDCIRDGLWKDYKTLAACALVCHSWLPRSQNQLFRAIILGNELQTKSVLYTLSIKPELGCLVEELRINITLKKNLSLNYAYKAVMCLPKYLTKLQKLGLSSDSDCKVLNDQFFWHCSRFITLQHLSLWEVQLGNFQLLNRLSNLKRLTCIKIQCGLASSTFCKKQYNLEYLDFGGKDKRTTEKLISWLIQSQPIKKLKSLEGFYVEKDNVAILSITLIHFAETLQHLGLWCFNKIIGN